MTMISGRPLTRSQISENAESFIDKRLGVLGIKFGATNILRTLQERGNIAPLAALPADLERIFEKIDPVGEWTDRANLARSSWVMQVGNLDMAAFEARNQSFTRDLRRAILAFCDDLEQKFPPQTNGEVADDHVRGIDRKAQMDAFVDDVKRDRTPLIGSEVDLGFPFHNGVTSPEFSFLNILMEKSIPWLIKETYWTSRNREFEGWRERAVRAVFEGMERDRFIEKTLEASRELSLGVWSVLTHWWKVEYPALAGELGPVPAFARAIIADEWGRILERGSEIFQTRLTENHKNPELEFAGRDENEPQVLKWLDKSRPAEMSPDLGELIPLVILEPFDCFWDAVLEAPEKIAAEVSSERLEAVFRELLGWTKHELESKRADNTLYCISSSGREKRLAKLEARCKATLAKSVPTQSHPVSTPPASPTLTSNAFSILELANDDPDGLAPKYDYLMTACGMTRDVAAEAYRSLHAQELVEKSGKRWRITEKGRLTILHSG